MSSDFRWYETVTVRRVVVGIPGEPTQKMMLQRFAGLEQKMGILRSEAASLTQINDDRMPLEQIHV